MAKSAELQDTLTASGPIPTAIQSKEERDSEKGKSFRPTAKQWIARIVLAEKFIREHYKPGWDMSLAFYNGEIESDNPNEVTDTGNLIGNCRINLAKSFVDTLQPNLYYQNPTWKAKTIQANEAFARVDEEALSHSFVERNSDEEMARLVHDGCVQGVGAAWFDRDQDRLIGFMRHVDIRDVIVPLPKLWRMEDQPWVAIKRHVSLAAAWDYFNDPKLLANESNPINGETIVFNRDNPDENLVYYQVYAKFGQERKIVCVTNGQKEGDVFLKQSSDTLDKLQNVKQVWREELPWPFALDKEDFPVKFLVLSPTTDSIYGHNPLAQVFGLILTINLLFEAMSERTRKAFAGKLLIDDSVDETKLKTLMSSIQMDALRVNLSGKTAHDFAQVLDLAGIQPHIYEFLATCKRFFDEVTGLSELLRGALSGGRRSATEASILEEQAGIRVSQMQMQIDRFLEKAGRMIRIINAQIMPNSVAQSIVNEKWARTGIFTLEQDGTSPWDKRSEDIEAILKEKTVEIQLNSARKYSTDTEVQKQMNLFMMIAKEIDPATQIPLLRAQERWAWIRDMCALAEIKNMDKKLPSEEQLATEQKAADEAKNAQTGAILAQTQAQAGVPSSMMGPPPQGGQPPQGQPQIPPEILAQMMAGMGGAQ